MTLQLSAGVGLLLSLISLALLVPSFVLWIECSAAFFYSEPITSPAKSPVLPDQLRVAVLIPAHNEAAVIKPTLESVALQMRTSDEWVVVADNCTDETAEIARQWGATVIERYDPTQRGKSYALGAGLSHLAANPPDVVVLVDADCLLNADVLPALVWQAYTTQLPAQAIYLMEPPPYPTARDRLSTFAFKVKNLVRPMGLHCLGWPCQLTGSGMAFPWCTVDGFDLSTNHLVEDMKLGYDLAIATYPPALCSDAFVTGSLPQDGAIATGQRRRWEHGHLSMMRSYWPRLMVEGIKQGRGDLLALAFDLTIPPLSLLVLLWGVGLAIALAAGWCGIGWGAAVVVALAGGLIAMAIALSWLRFARSELTLMQLASIGMYLLWKIPLGLTYFIKPQMAWVRTAREPTQK